MKIGLLENGLDSLQRGFESLNEYERLTINKQTGLRSSFLLKNAVLSIHHGIEILMKYILFKKCEFLIFDSIDKHLKDAYKEKNQKKLDSIFQTQKSHKLHTITYDEAFQRLKFICGHCFSEKFEKQITRLNEIRNQLTHSEIEIDDEDIISVFSDLLSEIDMYFFKMIGEEYQTLNGYSDLVKNYNSYMKYLEEKGLILKKEAIDCFCKIFEKLNFGMGLNEVKRFTDINQASSFITELGLYDFKFGTDLYNGYCSGEIKIKRYDISHFSIFTYDNNGEYIFKFRSMLLYLPSIDSDFSPIIIFEADDDNDLTPEMEKSIRVDLYNKKMISGLHFIADNKTIYNEKEINDFYDRMEYDEYFPIPEYYDIYKFISKGMFCFINIQGLEYGNFSKIITDLRDMDGREFEIILRNVVKKR